MNNMIRGETIKNEYNENARDEIYSNNSEECFQWSHQQMTIEEKFFI